MTSLVLPRRKFLIGAAALLAAPAIVRASSLMPVKVQEPMIDRFFDFPEKAFEGDIFFQSVSRKMFFFGRANDPNSWDNFGWIEITESAEA